jgi:hypothetical protein
MQRILVTVVALLLASATFAIAQTADIGGQIVRIEPEQQVIVLANGQMYRVAPTTTLFVNSQPVGFSGLRAGQSVVIRSGEPVMFQNGQYVVVGQAAPPATTGQIVTQAPAPSSVIVNAPPATVVPAGVRQTVYGRVEDVDSNGTVKIALDKDSFKVRLSRDTARQLREGDRVQVDMTIVPSGTPAASPR